MRNFTLPLIHEHYATHKTHNTRNTLKQAIPTSRNRVAMGGRSICSKLADSTAVEWSTNPKKKHTVGHRHYQKYSKARTLGEARKLGATTRDLVHDYDHGFLRPKSGPEQYSEKHSLLSRLRVPPVWCRALLPIVLFLLVGFERCLRMQLLSHSRQQASSRMRYN